MNEFKEGDEVVANRDASLFKAGAEGRVIRTQNVDSEQYLWVELTGTAIDSCPNSWLVTGPSVASYWNKKESPMVVSMDKKYRTVSGRPVRILCTDRIVHQVFPIGKFQAFEQVVGLIVEDLRYERLAFWNLHGISRNLREENLVEVVNEEVIYKDVVIIPELGEPDINGYIYTKEIALGIIQQAEEQGGGFNGVVGMPRLDMSLSKEENDRNLTFTLSEKISHRVFNLRIVGNKLVGDVRVLNTSHGNALKGMCADAMPDFRLIHKCTFIKSPAPHNNSFAGKFVNWCQVSSINAVKHENKPKLVYKDVVIIPELNKPNRNGRIYTTAIANSIIEQCQKTPQQAFSGMIGMPNIDTAIFHTTKYSDNPEAFRDLLRVPLEEMSHQVTNLRIVNEQLIGDVSLLNTPAGNKLKALMTADLVDFRLSCLCKLEEIGDFTNVVVCSVVAINAVSK